LNPKAAPSNLSAVSKCAIKLKLLQAERGNTLKSRESLAVNDHRQLGNTQLILDGRNWLKGKRNVDGNDVNQNQFPLGTAKTQDFTTTSGFSTGDFRLLLEAFSLPCLVLLPNVPIFTIVAANEHFLFATENSRSGLIGKGLFEIFPDSPDRMPASKKEVDLRTALDRIIENGRQAAPDAQVLHASSFRHYQVNVSPIFDTQGILAFILLEIDSTTNST
jgi:hypothetical protein